MQVGGGADQCGAAVRLELLEFDGVERYDGEVVFGRTRQAVGLLVSTDPIDCFRNRSPDVFLLRQMRRPKHVMGEVFC